MRWNDIWDVILSRKGRMHCKQERVLPNTLSDNAFACYVDMSMEEELKIKSSFFTHIWKMELQRSQKGLDCLELGLWSQWNHLTCNAFYSGSWEASSQPQDEHRMRGAKECSGLSPGPACWECRLWLLPMLPCHCSWPCCHDLPWSCGFSSEWTSCYWLCEAQPYLLTDKSKCNAK